MTHHSAYDGLGNVSDIHNVQAQVRRAGHLGAEELGADVDAGRHVGRESGSDDQRRVDHGEIKRTLHLLALDEIPRSLLCEHLRLWIRVTAARYQEVEGRGRAMRPR